MWIYIDSNFVTKVAIWIIVVAIATLVENLIIKEAGVQLPSNRTIRITYLLAVKVPFAFVAILAVVLFWKVG
jgi:hypothetical protein